MSEDGTAAEMRVRDMTSEDVPAVHRMIHELAEYEGVPGGPQLTEKDLIEDGFENSSPWFFGLVAERAGRLVGYALCNRAYSSWTRRAFYIEDLYVEPAARRSGAGMLLVQRLCQMAVAAGVHRVDWHVLAHNAPALAFYARLGARDLRATEGRLALRIDRAQIDSLAALAALDQQAPH